MSHQEEQIKEVSDITGEPTEAAAVLLRRARWNKEKLIEQYMDNPDKILENAGLGAGNSEPPRTQKMKDFTCDICFDDHSGIETFAMKCDHRYCIDCYRTYISQKIVDEGEAARIQCPKQGCRRIVDSKALELLVEANLTKRYRSCPFSALRS